MVTPNTDIIPTSLDEDGEVNTFPTSSPSVDGEVGAAEDNDIKNTRAAKYSFAVNDQEMDQDYMKSVLTTPGGIEKERESLSLRKEIQDTQFRERIIEEMSRAAGKEGRLFTPEERKVVEDLSSQEVAAARVNPKSVLEKAFAERLVNKAATVSEETPITRFPDVGEVLEEHIAKKEGYQKLAEDAEKAFKDQSWGQTVVNFGLTVVPFYQWYNMSNLLKGEKSLSYLPGSNLKENIESLHALPTDEALEAAERAYRDLKATNPVLARDFARALLSYSQSDAMWDNALVAGADVAGFVPFGKIAKGAKVFSTKMKAQAAYRDFSKVTGKSKVTVGEITDATGDIMGATGQKVFREVSERAAQSRAPQSWNELVQEIPSIFNPARIFEGTYNLSTTAVNRIIARMGVDNERLVKELLLDPIQNGALNTPEAIKIATQETSEALTRQYSRIENGVLDISTTNAENALGGVVEARVAIGTPAGGAFDSFGNADFYRNYVYGLNEATVVERGGAFHIEVIRPLDLTTDSVRDALVVQIKSDAKPLANMIGRWLTPIRSGEDVLPTAVSDGLKLSGFGGSKVGKLLNDLANPLVSLKKKEGLYSFLKYESNLVRPGSEDLTGSFSRSISELEQRWMASNGTLPSPQEVEAYYSYVRLNDLHYLTRNIDLFMEKSRRGHMEFTFSGNNVSADAISRFSLENIEGRLVTELPGPSSSNTRILVLDESPYVYNSSAREGNTNAARARELMNTEGYSLVQLSPEGVRKLAESEVASGILRGGKANYVLAKSTRSRPIPFKQLPYVEGGRRVAPQGHYVSTPNIGITPDGKKTVFYGDDNLFFAHTAADAKVIAERFDEARTMLGRAVGQTNGRITFETAKAADLTKLRQYVKDNLPISWREFKGMYIGPKAKYNLQSPILPRPSGQQTASIHKIEKHTGTPDGVELYAQSEHNSYRGHVNLEYAQERGDLIREVVRKGDPQLPEFGVQPGAVLDPLAAVNVALRGVAKGRNFNQMKQEAGERFVAQFEDIIDVPQRELRADPITHMMNAPFKKGADPQIVRDASAYRGRMKQFMGIKSDELSYFDYMAEKLLNGVSPDMATGWRKNFYEVLKGGDALSKFKGIAFHARIGLWNVKQLLLQAQTTSHVVGLAGPEIGMKAIGSSMIQNIALESADDLTKMGGDFFTKLGWGSADEFLEATQAMKRSGFDNVGREVATREQHFAADVINTGTTNILNHGMVFFNRSEAFVRRTAWNAAYMEWRKANPTKALKDQDIVGILRRADLMNVNMSQASNGAWQQGWSSIPTQFWSYQVRLTEQLAGKRLSGAEKARLLTTYSTLYGIPVTASAVAGVWPVHDTIRNHLLQNGVETDDDTIKTVLSEGVLGATVGLLAGEATNFSSVYGPSGLPFVKDILDGDKNVLEALVGASGGVFTEVLLDAAPIVPWVMRAVSPGSEPIPPKLSDFTDLFTNISSMKGAEKLWLAMSTGEYLSKYGETIDGGNSGAKAIFYSLFGVSPQRIEDMYLVLNNDRDRRILQRDMRRKAFEDMRRMISADNVDDMEYFKKRAQIRLNTPLFTPSEQVEASGLFFRENKTLMEKAIMRQKNNPALQKLLRDRYLKAKGNE